MRGGMNQTYSFLMPGSLYLSHVRGALIYELSMSVAIIKFDKWRSSPILVARYGFSIQSFLFFA